VVSNIECDQQQHIINIQINNDRGTTIGAYALGGLVGSLASKYFNDHFGRKTNIMIAGLWMIFGGLFSALSINIPMVIIKYHIKKTPQTTAR
jgi:predicted MFS family arabinose efflux permease